MDKDNFNIKEKLNSLDEIIEKMQNNELDFDTNIALYNKANKIIEELEKRLSQVREQIVKVVEKEEE